MPKKQTREAIEAEMNADEVERLVEDIEEFERRLQEVETGWGIAPSQNKPLIDRMRAVGMSNEAIDGVSDILEAITKIALGKMNELPDRVRRVAEIADAEISALDQLWNLLDARLDGRRALTVKDRGPVCLRDRAPQPSTAVLGIVRLFAQGVAILIVVLRVAPAL